MVLVNGGVIVWKFRSVIGILIKKGVWWEGFMEFIRCRLELYEGVFIGNDEICFENMFCNFL